MFKEKNTITKLLIVLALICTSLFSIFYVSKRVSSPEFHTESIRVLDEKKITAMELTAAVTVTSTAISALPGDMASPIANQVSGLTPYLLVVICAIYLEKFLLTITGYISFTFIIPFACLLFGIYVLFQKQVLKTIAIKLTLFAVAITLIIPFSVNVTKLVEATFQESITQTFEHVDEITQEAEKEDSNAFLDFINGISNSIANLADNAKKCISVFVDAIAVLIITTCIIPIAVFLVMAWIIKILFGLNFDFSKSKKLISKSSE